MTAIGQIPINKDISEYTSGILYKTTGIDFKQTGATTLYTVPTGYNCIVTEVIAICTSGSGLTIAAQGSVGTNASSYNNIMATLAFTGLSSNTSLYRYSVEGSSTIATAETAIKGNISIGATATSLVCDVLLKGILIPA